ncbi:MAG: hypothetical protein MHM6MM_009007, partial [Cercozoa sp. M6MM]
MRNSVLSQRGALLSAPEREILDALRLQDGCRELLPLFRTFRGCSSAQWFCLLTDYLFPALTETNTAHVASQFLQYDGWQKWILGHLTTQVASEVELSPAQDKMAFDLTLNALLQVHLHGILQPQGDKSSEKHRVQRLLTASLEAVDVVLGWDQDAVFCARLMLFSLVSRLAVAASRPTTPMHWALRSSLDKSPVLFWDAVLSVSRSVERFVLSMPVRAVGMPRRNAESPSLALHLETNGAALDLKLVQQTGNMLHQLMRADESSFADSSS